MFARPYITIIIVFPIIVRGRITKSDRIRSRSNILFEIKLPSIGGII